MSSFWKLKALLKKNIQEMKRNVLSTLLEIFLPIILIFLFYVLKTAYEIDNINFEDEEQNYENFIKNRSFVHANFNKKDELIENFGLSDNFSIFANCSVDYYYPRPSVAVIGDKEDEDLLEKIKDKIIKEIEYINNGFYYTTVEEMEKHITDKEYYEKLKKK